MTRRTANTGEPMRNVVSQAAFARMNGWSRSHVTQLKKAGRLSVTDNGRVRVRESLERIRTTEDPSKAHVAERHERARQAKKTNTDQPNSDAPQSSTGTYTAHRAQKERYAALMAQIDYWERIGSLVSKTEVEAAASDFGAQLRRTLEGLPDQVAELVAAESDPARVHALLLEEIDSVLSDLSHHLKPTEEAA